LVPATSHERLRHIYDQIKIQRCGNSIIRTGGNAGIQLGAIRKFLEKINAETRGKYAGTRDVGVYGLWNWARSRNLPRAEISGQSNPQKCRNMGMRKFVFIGKGNYKAGVAQKPVNIGLPPTKIRNPFKRAQERKHTISQTTNQQRQGIKNKLLSKQTFKPSNLLT
jgi:hypothetical protein